MSQYVAASTYMPTLSERDAKMHQNITATTSCISFCAIRSHWLTNSRARKLQRIGVADKCLE